ncbi:MAG: bacillithiol system redox-active protein YtxJ, partial [Acidobacteriota bacterium]
MADYAHIRSVSEIDDLIAQSHDKPVIFFKHSLTCPISSAGFRQYETFLADQSADGEAIYTLIEIQNARDVSNEIAQRTGVKHESPQALLMRDGTVTWHASHWSIQAEAL